MTGYLNLTLYFVLWHKAKLSSLKPKTYSSKQTKENCIGFFPPHIKINHLAVFNSVFSLLLLRFFSLSVCLSQVSKITQVQKYLKDLGHHISYVHW